MIEGLGETRGRARKEHLEAGGSGDPQQLRLQVVLVGFNGRSWSVSWRLAGLECLRTRLGACTEPLLPSTTARCFSNLFLLP